MAAASDEAQDMAAPLSANISRWCTSTVELLQGKGGGGERNLREGEGRGIYFKGDVIELSY